MATLRWKGKRLYLTGAWQKLIGKKKIQNASAKRGAKYADSKQIRLEHDGGEFFQIDFSVAGSVGFPYHIRQLGVAEGQTRFSRRSSETVDADATGVIVVEKRESLENLVENILGISLRIDDDLQKLVKVHA